MVPGAARVSRASALVSWGVALFVGCGPQREVQQALPAPSAGTAGAESAGGTGGEGGGSPRGDCSPRGEDYCVSDCLEKRVLVENASCVEGAWSCSSGYRFASTCPERACATTLDRCCDLTTGALRDNPCDAAGFRPSCPAGAREADERFCVPESLADTPCILLDEEPCLGPAESCRDFSLAEVRCACQKSDAGAEAANWHCSASTGP